MDEKDKKIQELTEVIRLLEEESRFLKERVAQLERRLGLDSETSSKPPSSDGLRKKPRPMSLRSKGKNPSGGQIGHKGSTLYQVEAPDFLEIHSPEICGSCGKTLDTVETAGVTKRQVFDITPSCLEVTEHQSLRKVCACGHSTTGRFPETVRGPVHYGKRLQALVVYLMNQHFLPEDRLQSLLKDLFNVSIATDTLASINKRFARTIEPFQAMALEQAKEAPVKNVDETGFRIEGKTQWLHVVTTSEVTHYRVSETRKDLDPLKDMKGTVVHDHWKPYFQIEGVDHSLCNAHHLRELKALMEIEKEPWAQKMDQLLRCAHRFKDPPIQRISKLYDQILCQGLSFHEGLPSMGKTTRKRRVGHNLLLRLRDKKDETLRFLSTPNVPFTNNQAEQDIRMMKVKQKISGGFRSIKGADAFATIRGFISTMRKQDHNVFEAISCQFAL